MKRFICIGLGFIVVAVLLSVAVWWWIQVQMQTASVKPTAPLHSDSTTVDASIEESASINTGTAEPVPLRDVPLSDTQKKAAEKVGIDIDTFEITPAMVDCAIDSVGEERVDEIVAGDTPTVLESFRLLGCIKAD